MTSISIRKTIVRQVAAQMCFTHTFTHKALFTRSVCHRWQSKSFRFSLHKTQYLHCENDVIDDNAMHEKIGKIKFINFVDVAVVAAAFFITNTQHIR